MSFIVLPLIKIHKKIYIPMKDVKMSLENVERLPKFAKRGIDVYDYANREEILFSVNEEVIGNPYLGFEQVDPELLFSNNKEKYNPL